MESILFVGSIICHLLFAGNPKKQNISKGRERKKADTFGSPGSLWAALCKTHTLGYFKAKTQREHRIRTSALVSAWNSLSQEEKVALVSLVRRNKIQQVEKLDWALSNGIDVCVDLSYEKQQTIGELRSLARQLSNTYAMMKRVSVPCHLHITSIGSHGKTLNTTDAYTGEGTGADDASEAGLIDAALGEGFSRLLYNQWLKLAQYLSTMCRYFSAITRRSAAGMKQKEKPAGDNADTILFLEKMGYANWKISKHAGGPSEVAAAPAPSGGESISEEGAASASKPARSIVYLSPDAPEALSHFDPACVYVIGGIVDCTVRSGLTKNRARSVGAVCRRLPIQEYIPEHANHILNVDCCVHIVCTHLETGDWVETFKRTLPQRKLVKGGKAERYRRNKDKDKDKYTDDSTTAGAGDSGEDEGSSESLGGSLEVRAANSRWIRWIEREIGLEYGTKNMEKATSEASA